MHIRERKESTIAAVARAALAALAASSLGACFVSRSAPPPLPEDFAAEHALLLAADEPFTGTGWQVLAGDVVEVAATGEVAVRGPSLLHWNRETLRCGPDGTYLYDHDLLDETWPVPAGSAGPAPAFALIARIGTGNPPFVVGARHAFRCDATGELHLGLNDFRASDNRGALRIGLRRAPPALMRERIPRDTRPIARSPAEPRPVEDARVVLIFVDGLRHDVLVEMVHAGRLPNLKRIFFEGGVDVERAFTISPSNTLPATVACLTGCWPDRTGFFTQCRFDRGTGELDYLIDVTGPADAARSVEAAWWDMYADEASPELLGTILERHDLRMGATMVPVAGDYPPDFWFQRMANEAPLFGVHLLHTTTSDRVQTAHLVERIATGDHHVMMIWYPAVDSLAHQTPRGLFGASRVALAGLDADLPAIEAALSDAGIAEKTSFVLFADHGSSGGRDRTQRSYDLAHELLFAPLRDDDRDGVLDAGAGLGLNVLALEGDVPVLRRHPDQPEEDFAVCAAQAYGMAWLALPVAAHDSRDWTRPNRLAELRAWQAHGEVAPIDVPRRLLDVRVTDVDAAPERADRPIEMVLVPLPPDRVLILGQDGTALIERRVRTDEPRRGFDYRYRVLASIEADAENGLRIVEAAPDATDPLGLRDEAGIAELEKSSPGWLADWHDDREWLEATAETRYPDAICAFSHHLLNDPRAPRFDPRRAYDLVAVAAEGWGLGPGSTVAGVDHGGPQREAVHIPFLVAGPNVARGVRVTRPARILDVLPTVLDLLGVKYDGGDFDGRAVREIWAGDGALERPAAPSPVPAWADRYVPPSGPQRERLVTAHHKEAWYDLHNVAANLAGLTQQEVFRLADRAVDTLVPGGELRPVEAGPDAAADSYDRLPDGRLKTRPADLLRALRLRNITIGEFFNPVQSLQHFDRAVGVIRWVQEVVRDPFEPVVDRDSVVWTPIDLPLDGAAWVLDGTKDLLMELFIRVGDGIVFGAESSARFVAGAFESDEVPRFARDPDQQGGRR